MSNFKLDGININDEGTGKPLIFVHAFPLCNRMWDEQVKYFKDKYRVITYDIRGLGYSNNLSDYSYTMEDLVNDFFNIINELKLEKVNACGLSMGGYILLRALVREQERFSSVILADTKATGENNTSLINRSQSIARIKSGGKDQFIDEFLIKLISEENYKGNERLKNFVREMMGWMDVKGLCSALIAIATRTTTLYELKNIHTPSLVLAGEMDSITPPTDAFMIKENMKNARMKKLKGAGHLSNMEVPQEFNKIVEDFLQTIE